jgi:hypothetical protein
MILPRRLAGNPTPRGLCWLFEILITDFIG